MVVTPYGVVWIEFLFPDGRSGKFKAENFQLWRQRLH